MAMDRKRDSSGQFVAPHDISEADVLGAMDPLEPYTTREIADILAIPRRSTYEYLETLAKQGRIRKKKPASRRVIWIHPEDTA